MYLQTEESLCVYFSPPSTLLKDSCKKKFGFICEKEVINSRIKRQTNFKNDGDDELNRAIDEAKRNLDLTRKPEILEDLAKEDFKDASEAHDSFLAGRDDPIGDQWSKISMINIEALKILKKEKGIPTSKEIKSII